MKAIQIELFPVAPTHIAGATAGMNKQHTTGADYKNMVPVNLYDADGRVCARATIDTTMTLDPCRSCPLRELCEPDNCGQKLYDVDVPEQEYTPFEDWVDAPLY